ncbi:threonine kinase [Serratia fonticola]|uniref:Threonine kinase n=1 Tax=Serratia fonticola TaxID=47917 RepID=A0A542BNR7_SERFO|nr:GHMP kinase [Serratia fonticola]TQI80117.1 threonine kinase [Serratia fonticola]TQI97856.1 threonine kinase [Serratia fonticola]TVZ72354.1 threonine kinase [Serratia fonticola]
MAEASCPASCGELLQGWILGGEKLVSCPINWFSHVAVTDGQPAKHERPLMRQMLLTVLEHLGMATDIARGLRIDFHSTIPLAKGMASSTADIAATAQAAARHLGSPLDEATLARLCVQLEPTDSTLFRRLTLFDHQTAALQHPFDWLPTLDILLLESPQTLNTADYHRRDRHHALLDNAATLAQAWELFSRAMKTHDCGKLGEATTLSARASQTLLPKPRFDDLLALVEQSGIYGLNVAHSGSVVGLLFDAEKHDSEKLCWLLQQRQISESYPQQHYLTLIHGGVR